MLEIPTSVKNRQKEVFHAGVFLSKFSNRRSSWYLRVEMKMERRTRNELKTINEKRVLKSL
jgi:hypothetical protein